MPVVEAFGHKDALDPLFTAEFNFLPRIGECLARDTPLGYFIHYNVGVSPAHEVQVCLPRFRCPPFRVRPSFNSDF